MMALLILHERRPKTHMGIGNEEFYCGFLLLLFAVEPEIPAWLNVYTFMNIIKVCVSLHIRMQTHKYVNKQRPTYLFKIFLKSRCKGTLLVQRYATRSSLQRRYITSSAVYSLIKADIFAQTSGFVMRITLRNGVLNILFLGRMKYHFHVFQNLRKRLSSGRFDFLFSLIKIPNERCFEKLYILFPFQV